MPKSKAFKLKSKVHKSSYNMLTKDQKNRKNKTNNKFDAGLFPNILKYLDCADTLNYLNANPNAKRLILESVSNIQSMYDNLSEHIVPYKFDKKLTPDEAFNEFKYLCKFTKYPTYEEALNDLPNIRVVNRYNLVHAHEPRYRIYNQTKKLRKQINPPIKKSNGSNTRRKTQYSYIDFAPFHKLINHNPGKPAGRIRRGYKINLTFHNIARKTNKNRYYQFIELLVLTEDYIFSKLMMLRATQREISKFITRFKQIMVLNKDKYKEYTKKGRIQKILKETIKNISDNKHNSKFKYLGYNTDIPYHRQFDVRD